MGGADGGGGGRGGSGGRGSGRGGCDGEVRGGPPPPHDCFASTFVEVCVGTGDVVWCGVVWSVACGVMCLVCSVHGNFVSDFLVEQQQVSYFGVT